MKQQELIDQLVREARQQRDPGVDLSAIGAKLFERVARGEAPRFPVPHAAGFPRWPLAVVAAAAAAVLLWPRSRAPAPPVVPVASAPAVAPAPAPASIRKFHASAEGQAIEVPGKASLWIEAESEGTFREGDRLSVVLDQGAVILDVVPQSAPDRVEVLAGNFRISVKGTRFRVARHADQVEVDVEHGAVQVTSLDGAAAPVLLRGPVGGSYPTHPTRAFRPFHEEPASVGSVAVVPGPSSKNVFQPTRPPRPAPVPSSAELRGHAHDLASSCVRSSSSVAPGVLVTIETTLTLNIAPGGYVESFAFEPPLTPATEQCFRKEKGKLRGPVGRHSAALTITLDGR
jgi:hypothetical protein